MLLYHYLHKKILFGSTLKADKSKIKVKQKLSQGDENARKMFECSCEHCVRVISRTTVDKRKEKPL